MLADTPPAALIAKGHRQIGLIRFRSHLAGDDLALRGMNQAIQSHRGDPLPTPIVLSHNFHVERLTLALDKLYSSSLPPSALVVLNHHHFVTAFSHLMSRGIRIPGNVSIISLSHDTLLDRLSPAPVYYTVGERLIRDLTRLILNPTKGKSSKSSLLMPEVMPGKTVSSPG